MALRVAGVGVARQVGEDSWESCHGGPLSRRADSVWGRRRAECAARGQRGQGVRGAGLKLGPGWRDLAGHQAWVAAGVLARTLDAQGDWAVLGLGLSPPPPWLHRSWSSWAAAALWSAACWRAPSSWVLGVSCNTATFR